MLPPSTTARVPASWPIAVTSLKSVRHSVAAVSISFPLTVSPVNSHTRKASHLPLYEASPALRDISSPRRPARHIEDQLGQFPVGDLGEEDAHPGVAVQRELISRKAGDAS